MSKQTKQELDNAKFKWEHSQLLTSSLRRQFGYAEERLHSLSEGVSKQEIAEDVRAKLFTLAVENHNRSEERACYAKSRSLAAKYNITLENDSSQWGNERDFKYWIGCPGWIPEDEDPLVDGHFAHSWASVLWLVEFYAKHHVDHPEYEQREMDLHGPDC